MDYRQLNEVTRKDSFPLPRIDDTLQALEGSSWFSTLDLASGYWQVEMDPDDAPKTAFATERGLWQFKVLPMGLCNAGATFQRLMQMVFRGLDWKILLIYLDDLIVHSKTFDEHLIHEGSFSSPSDCWPETNSQEMSAVPARGNLLGTCGLW